MARTAKHQAELTPIPLLRTESLYIGIDIGKDRHVAGFVSTTLLARHERFAHVMRNEHVEECVPDLVGEPGRKLDAALSPGAELADEGAKEAKREPRTGPVRKRGRAAPLGAAGLSEEGNR